MLGRFVFSSLFTLLVFSLTAQEANDIVYNMAEVMPMFPGCENEPDSLKELCAQKAFMQYLGTVNYPQKAKDKDQQGKVYISFVVDKDGSITDVEAAKSSGYKLLDNAAIEHFENMPDWEPGQNAGQPVKVAMVVPLNFKQQVSLPKEFLTYKGQTLNLPAVDEYPVHPLCDHFTDPTLRAECSYNRIKEWLVDVPYPLRALEKSDSGTVIAKVLVNESGAVSVKELSQSSGNALLDSFALRYLAVMPDLLPAHKDGQPVAIEQYLPIQYMIPPGPNFVTGEYTMIPELIAANPNIEVDEYPIHKFYFGPYSDEERQWLFWFEMVKYLNNIKLPQYMPGAPDMMGKARFKLTINETGEVSEVQVIKGSGYSNIDNTVVSALKQMQDWRPASKDKQKVSFPIYIPFSFWQKPITIRESEMYHMSDLKITPPVVPGCEGLSGAELRDCNEDRLWQYIGSMEFPSVVTRFNIEGKVQCLFVINKEGKVVDPQIYSSCGYPLLDYFVLEYIKKLPDMQPAMRDGEPIETIGTAGYSFTIY